MIEFSNVALKYHYDDFALLKGASFTLLDGVNTVVCDTQSGKSSICKLLCKQISPTSGEITVDGLPISSITNEHLGILYLPNAPTFFEGRSVLYNVAYPLKVRKVGKAERKQKAEQIAAALGIDFLNVKVKELTAEQRKTVALARGMTVERKVVLFDDFFQADEDVEGALSNAQGVLKIFENATRVILTSDKRLAMGNTVVLDGGVTVFEGSATEAQSVVDNLEWLTTKLRSK